MSTLREAVEALVSTDRLVEAADRLREAAADRADLRQEATALRGSIERHATSLRRGVIAEDDYDRERRRASVALLGILDDLEAGGPSAPPAGVPPHATAPLVFLSYNHQDTEVVLALRAALERHGLRVHLDRDEMEPGEGIRDFIERSIRHTDATVCVVSNRSLMSAWVAMETINAFYAEKGPSGRRFIACYLDDDFFAPRFGLETTERIDAKIAEIEALLPDYAEKRLDPTDLNAEKTRLYALRNNLSTILLRLKESLTLDVRGEELEPSAAKIGRTLLGD